LTTTVILENSKDHVAYYLRGSARIDAGLERNKSKMVRDGIADAREAIRLGGQKNPMYYLPYLNGMNQLSIIEDSKKHAEVALSIADRILKQLTLTSEIKGNVLYHRGTSKIILDKIPEGIADFKLVIRVFPKHLGAYLSLADMYIEMEKPNEAMKYYNLSVDNFSNNPLVYNNRGMFFQQQKKYDKAISDFTKSLQLDPQYYFAYTNRGYTLLLRNQASAALNDFNSSLRINQQQPVVYGFRSTTHIALGNLRAALQDSQSVIKLEPQNFEAHADLGFVYFFMGNYPSCQREFQKALSLNQDLQYLDPWRYTTMIALKQNDQARQLYEKSSHKKTEDKNWNDHLLAYLAGTSSDEKLLGSVFLKNGDVRNDQLCEAHYFIGLQKSRSGDKAKAREHFQLALKTNATNLSAYRGAQIQVNQHLAGARRLPNRR